MQMFIEGITSQGLSLKEVLGRRMRIAQMRKDGHTFTSIGKKLGISRQRAQQLFASNERLT
jgi:DNA-directed RNA polymerase sigma subunit (sigma70/sigma32)